MLHLVDAILGWVLFVICAFFISSQLRHDEYWRPWNRMLTALAWLSVLLLLALVVVVVTKLPIGGLVEKAFILDRNIWAFLLAMLAFNAPSAQDSEPRSLPL